MKRYKWMLYKCLTFIINHNLHSKLVRNIVELEVEGDLKVYLIEVIMKMILVIQ